MKVASFCEKGWKNWVNCKKAKYFLLNKKYMLICSEVYWKINKNVDINVQRLDSEDNRPINYPRAPDNL